MLAQSSRTLPERTRESSCETTPSGLYDSALAVRGSVIVSEIDDVELAPRVLLYEGSNYMFSISGELIPATAFLNQQSPLLLLCNTAAAAATTRMAAR